MKPLNPAALGPLYEAAEKVLASIIRDFGEPIAYTEDTRSPSCPGVAGAGMYPPHKDWVDLLRSALTLAEQPGEAKVKRWTPTLFVLADGNCGGMIEADAGAYVLFTDYATLSAQLAAATEVVQLLQGELKALLALVQGECPRLLEDDHHYVSATAALARAAALGVK